MTNLPDAVPILPVYTDADIAVTPATTDVNPVTQLLDDLAINVNQLAAASSAVHGFGVDPGLCYYPVTQPTGAETLVASIPGGRLRYTAGAGNTSATIRVLLPSAKSGSTGNAEVRSTFAAASSQLTDANGLFQPGHSHRVTADKQIHRSSIATSGAVGALTDTAAGWTAGMWAGPTAFGLGEFYVTILFGAGIGQTRPIASNTTTALTPRTNFATAPDATSQYIIWTYNSRGLTFTQNVAFNAHATINFNAWEGSVSTLVGGVDLAAYLKPGGTYVQYPWFFKSRVVGKVAEFAVWKGADPETAYGTAGRSGSFTIPAGFEQTGMHGLYLGHMNANDWFEFDNLTVVKL